MCSAYYYGPVVSDLSLSVFVLSSNPEVGMGIHIVWESNIRRVLQ